MQSRYDKSLLLVVIGLLGLPPVVELMRDHVGAPLRYFAADAFYYLVIARNWAETGVFAFDQSNPTNGFHPLWQLLTGMIYRAGATLGASDHGSLIAVLGASAVLVTAGAGLLIAAVQREQGGLSPWVLVLPVGVYGVLLAPVWLVNAIVGFDNTIEGPIPLYGTLWSFINGMESGATIAAFGLCAYVMTWESDRPIWKAVGLGLSLSVLVLARLDHALIAAPILLAWGLPAARGEGPGPGSLLAAAIAFSLPVVLYVGANVASFGSPVPLSGVTKSSFPIPQPNNFIILADALTDPFSDTLWLDRFYRQTQILVPMLAAVVWFVRRPAGMDARRGRGWDRFLTGTATGVLVLGAYNYLFVAPMATGHWYFPVSIVFVSLVFLRLGPGSMRLPIPRHGLGVALVAGTLVAYVALHRRDGYHDKYVAFYVDEAPELVAAYAGMPAPRLVEFDDGIVAYATGFPAMSGFGLTLDREAHAAFVADDDTFFELALRRGHDRAVTLAYGDLALADLERFSKFGLSSADFRLTLDYVAQDGRFGIVRFRRRESEGAEPRGNVF